MINNSFNSFIKIKKKHWIFVFGEGPLDFAKGMHHQNLVAFCLVTNKVEKKD